MAAFLLLKLSIIGAKKSPGVPRRVILILSITASLDLSRVAAPARGAEPHPGRRPLERHLLSKAHELGRPAAGIHRHFAGFLDQPLLSDQAAEVLLMERDARQRLGRLLQFRKRESGRHEFRSEEHTSELQSLMRISYAVFCLKKK